MKKNLDKVASAKASDKIVRTQKIIVIVMIVCIVLPFFLAWMSGSLRF